MRTTIYSLLIAAFVLSTLPFGDEEGDDCENCASHGDTAQSCPESNSHAHGDSDDRHEGPDSPCSHDKDYHCCCGHVQAMIGVAAVESFTQILGELVIIASQGVKMDPSLRQTFHIPIA